MKRPRGSKVGEIDESDLYEPADEMRATADCKASHGIDVYKQFLTDDAHHPKTRVVLQVIARILGQTFARCVSNVIVFFTGRAFLDARRDYPLLPPSTTLVNASGEPLKIDGQVMTAASLAERYKPTISTISEDQAVEPSLRAVEIRYEVLPPHQSKGTYAIIYYVRRASEHMPLPFVGSLLAFLRPLLYGSKSEWNAIKIDIDRDTGEPQSINYESSNYTGDPLSFEITSGSDLHLPAKAVLRDKKWVHTLHQKDNRAKTHDIENPFEKSTHPEFAFVNWNGALDLVNATRLLGYEPKEAGVQKKTLLYPMEKLPCEFLDIDTFREQAFDLRNQWLRRRQAGRCYLPLPPRKEPTQFRVVNLISETLPSLVARNDESARLPAIQ